MKRRIVLRAAAALLSVCFLLSVRPAAQAAPGKKEKEKADAFFQALFEQKKAMGGAVILNQNGKRQYALFYGTAGGKRDVTEKTVYKVASVTKMITAIGVMQLVEQGRLSLDAPLLKSNGKPIRNPAWPKADITLRQAMSHTSSLLPTANYTGTPRWSAAYFSQDAPGSAYAYSNLNGGILGSLIEGVTGQSLNTFMRENVFTPLGVNAAYAAPLLSDTSSISYSFAPDDSVDTSAASYLRVGESYDDTCKPESHFRSSVGNLFISLKGMEQLGALLANGGTLNGKRLLSPGSVHLMQLDQRLAGGSVTGESPYGLNTYRYTLEGVTWYGHQGWWNGRLTDLFYEPESRTAVVLVMNGIPLSPGTVDRQVASPMEKTLLYMMPWVKEAMGDMSIIEEDD